MTDIASATPSAIEMAMSKSAIDIAPSTDKATTDKATKTKPEKPDEDEYKAELTRAEKEHADAQNRFKATKIKSDSARPGNKDSPAAKRQKELRDELAGIREQQQGFKSSRGNVQEKLASLDAQLKSRIQEQKNARNKVPFKNVEELDSAIARIEKQVDSGTMKLVDEKKALAEVSSLRKQRKGFAGFEESEKGITSVKTQISELKKSTDNPQQKGLSERYNTIAKELDSIKAEQDDAFKNMRSLNSDRDKAHADQEEKWVALKAVKDAYYAAKREYRAYEQEAYKVRQDRQRLERETYAKEKRKKVAESKLEEASNPAFIDEILTAEGLIRYFDPNTPAEQKVLRGPSGFAAEAQRQVDDSTIKGTRISKKEDRDDMYFAGLGGKKGKKSKGSKEAASTDGKFNVPFGVMEELGKVNVNVPSSQADIPSTIEQLKEKVSGWKTGQASQTKKNIAKAQAEIDKLEVEAQEDSAAGPADRPRDFARKPSRKIAGLNGDKSDEAEGKQEKDAIADATEDLKKPSIEDKTTAES